MITKNHTYDATVAASYDADRMHEAHWDKENEFIRHFFANKVASTILDIPIGTGRFLEFYPTRAKIVGVDISPHMIEQAERRLLVAERKSLDLRVGDAKNMAFLENGSVETIVCCRLLHLIDTGERKEVLREFARVLRGELILQTYLRFPKKPILTRLPSRFVQILKKLLTKENQIGPSHKPWSNIRSYPLTEAELADLCIDVGFQIVSKVHLCFYNEEEVSMFVLQKST